MLRLLIGLALIACLAAPALAQRRTPPSAPPDQTEQLRKKKDAEAVDRDYKAALERTNKAAAPPAAADPWQNMRAPSNSDR